MVIYIFIYLKTCIHNVDSICEIASGLWFSPWSPVSATNKTDHHYITEVMLIESGAKHANQCCSSVFLYSCQYNAYEHNIVGRKLILSLIFLIH